jgi:hypothetical protein
MEHRIPFGCRILLSSLGLLVLFLGARPAWAQEQAEEALLGHSFPALQGETLAGDSLKLPDSAVGQVTLLAVGFEREGASQFDSWYEAVHAHFDVPHELQLYGVYMISRGYYPLAGLIEKGIRNKLDSAKHDVVMTTYQPVWRYFRRLHVEDRNKVYIFLLDRRGRVQYRAAGFATNRKIQEMRQHCRLLISQH